MTGDELKTFTHKHIVKVVDFSHDSGSLLSGCNDKMLRVFDLSRPDSDPQLLAGSSSAVKSAVWTREPAMLSSCCEDKDITLWDTRTGGVAKTLVLESLATSIELSHDRQYLTVAHGSMVTVINAASFEKIKTFSVPLCYSATLHPSGKWLVTGGDDFKLYKFDYEEEKEVESYKGHFGPVHCVRYSPDGEVYCSGSEDGTIRLWQHSVGKSYGLWRSADEVVASRNNHSNNSSNNNSPGVS
jgi:serine-threonine kinase receptor-associated protein